MATYKLTWDEDGKKLYETGVSNGVLYPSVSQGVYGTGVAWNGLSSVQENPSGAESTKIYADNNKYLDLMSAEEFGATIEAYTYPDEFAECDGSTEIANGVFAGQQTRKMFGMSYKTIIGNDVSGDGYGYKLHLIYGAKASPSEKSYSTVNDSPEAISLSYTITTTPVEIPGHKKAASLTIDSTKADASKLAVLESILYGSDTEAARLPLPDEVIHLMGAVV